VVADGAVDVVVRGDQVEVEATGIAVRRQRQRRQHDRPHAAGRAVPGGVEERQVRGVAVDRVVEGVAADVVAGLQHPADHHVAGGERQRGQLAA
jgi:hypothetical protein